MSFVIVATTLTGCGSSGWEDLALAEDWILAEADADPWPDRPAEATPCPARTVHEESGSVEIDTNECFWVSLIAPARHAVSAGEPVELLFFHSALVADPPAEAVMAVAFGDVVLWQQTAPVPSASAFYTPEVPAPVDLGVGDPLVLHVHNHGSNTYQLGHLRAWTP